MNYLVVGVNHKTAPIEIRERLALPRDSVCKVMGQTLGQAAVKEIAVLSTCNRTEMYTVSPDTEGARGVLARNFAHTFDLDKLENCLYAKTDREAVAHLFSVVSSLDSLVVGENQIAKQVKEAYQLAVDNAATGPYLNRLFNRALFVAKRVKTETEISKGNVSVGSVGVVLAKRIFGSLSDKSVVLYGSGEIGELVLRHLKTATDVGSTFIINRNPEKSKALEADGLGTARLIEELDEALLQTDIFITSVSGGFESLHKEYFSRLMHKRRNRPLFIIDLGLPRNIAAPVGELNNIYLYNIDDLKTVADENQGSRQSEILMAKNIIDEETRLFYETYLDQRAIPMIAGLNRKFDEIRRRELEKTLARMPHLSESDRGSLEQLTKAIVARILHDPILHLKNRGEKPDSPVLSVIRKIFSLDDEGNHG